MFCYVNTNIIGEDREMYYCMSYSSKFFCFLCSLILMFFLQKFQHVFLRTDVTCTKICPRTSLNYSNYTHIHKYLRELKFNTYHIHTIVYSLALWWSEV